MDAQEFLARGRFKYRQIERLSMLRMRKYRLVSVFKCEQEGDYSIISARRIKPKFRITLHRASRLQDVDEQSKKNAECMTTRLSESCDIEKYKNLSYISHVSWNMRI